ncbi:HlyD family efflux transporter periplasmic adaptor subunit [Marinithermofilum abyssi]|nr:HlyD family secretion protein [Marinithermofilum abyssi]
MVAAGIVKNNNQAEEVKVASLETKTIQETVITSGTLEPVDQEKIYADQGQKIREVRVKPGDKVKEGAALFRYELPVRTVRSVKDGTVIQVNENPASGLGGESEPVVVIADLDEQQVTAEASEFDALKLKKGQRVTLQSDILPEKKWKGRVKEVAYLPEKSQKQGSAESEQIRYPVTIELEHNLPLKLGSRLMAEIQTDPKRVKSLPQSTVVE